MSNMQPNRPRSTLAKIFLIVGGIVLGQLVLIGLLFAYFAWIYSQPGVGH